MHEEENSRVSYKGDNKSIIAVTFLCVFKYLLFSLSDAVADLDILSTA